MWTKVRGSKSLLSGPTEGKYFIAKYSVLQVPDKLELVYRLYKSYYDVLGRKGDLTIEPFDQFFADIFTV